MDGVVQIQRRANDELSQHFQGNRENDYDSVQVLLLCWAKSDLVGFKDEALKLEELFSGSFHYQVTYFEIPPKDCHLALDEEILRFVTQAKSTRSLSIIHYGGHGDENIVDLAGNPGEGVSVWAATAKDDLTRDNSLTWSEIQPKLRYANGDVLLILDCCFAAMAARRRTRRFPSNVECLAACAMGNETLSPGQNRWTFTKALTSELTDIVNQGQSVTVSRLHHILADRDRRLPTTPVHFSLEGERRATIRLSPIRPPAALIQLPLPRSEIRLRMILRSPLSPDLIDDIVLWLKTNAPAEICDLAITDMLQQAVDIKRFVSSGVSRGGSVARIENLPELSRHEVQGAWTSFIERLGYGIRFFIPISSASVTTFIPEDGADRTRVVRFLRDFETNLSTLQRVIERNILELPELFNEAALKLEAQDTLLNDMGVAESLRIRLSATVAHPSIPPPFAHRTKGPSHQTSALVNPLTLDEVESKGRVLVEYKYFDQGDKEMKEFNKQRIKRLVSVLQSAKSTAFRTPECLGIIPDEDMGRYKLAFQVPILDSSPINLYSVLGGHAKGDKSLRVPTLGERFQLARAIGQALMKWHGADWVHQGIASYNIVFFKTGNVGIDYTQPFLCGFDYARKSGETSNQRRSEESKLMDIYRHPDRQGYPPPRSHSKKHDIYSFGLLLLEIGLWTALPTAFERFIAQKGTSSLHQEILRKVPERLAHDMGSAYESAILTCLKGELGGDVDDVFQARVMYDFEYKVLRKLEAGTGIDGTTW